jgi:hypothetical protein
VLKYFAAPKARIETHTAGEFIRDIAAEPRACTSSLFFGFFLLSS